MKRAITNLLRGCKARSRKKVTRAFNELYYNGPNGVPLFQTVSWLGVTTLKCPLDLWIYQEIVTKTRPDVIIEAGVHYGGATLFLASICDLLGAGEVLGCDITLASVESKVRSHPRIKLFEGSSTDPQIHGRIAAQCAGRRTMVILDSDHSEDHVREELRLYAPLVTRGGYLICEDTNVNGHPVLPDFGPGPFEAVSRFLSENDGWKVDVNCERLLVTFNPSGYLLRAAD